MSENKRIRKAINWLISQGRFSSQKDIGEKLGIINRSYLSQLVNSEMPNESFINKFTALAPEISRTWLLTGEGKMLVDTAAPEAPGVSMTGVPLIPVEAMAGYFTGEVSVRESDCERVSVPGLKADFVIPIAGDSMQPSYRSGDLVACQRIDSIDTFFQWGRVYVIDTAQGVLIKQVRRSSTPGNIVLVSENPIYDPIDLPQSEIYHIALVQGLIRIY